MATRIWPSENDVHDTTGGGRKPTEENLTGFRNTAAAQISHYRSNSSKVSAGGYLTGFDFDSGSATSITLTAGTATIEGYNIEETTTISGTLIASMFNYVFLTLDKTSDLVTGISLSVDAVATFNAAVTVPADSILLWCFETDGSSIVTQYDFRTVGSNTLSGQYVGDATASRTINLGARPKLVQVFMNEDSGNPGRTFVAQSPMAVPRGSGQQRGMFWGNPGYVVQTNDPEHVPIITADGFTIEDGPATPAHRVWLEATDTGTLGTINAGLTDTQDITVAGARVGDIVILDLEGWTSESVSVHANVISDDTVRVYAHNAGSTSTDMSVVTNITAAVFSLNFEPELNRSGQTYYFIAWF